jgi:hypothetical protein
MKPGVGKPRGFYPVPASSFSTMATAAAASETGTG